MDITQLRTLVHVAELGSLSRAAERLNTVQPALSRQIRLLEEELKVQLFERHGRGMSVTPIGREVIASASRIMVEVDTIREAVTDVNQSFRGQVRIGLTPTIGEILARRLTSQIQQDHPKLDVEFKVAFSNSLVDWLQRGSLDIIAGFNPPQSHALRVEPVLLESLYLLDVPGSGLALDRPVRFQSLGGAKFVLPAPEHTLRQIVDNCARLAGVSIQAATTADSMYTTLQLVKAGFGKTVLPLGPVLGDVRAGLLEAAPLIEPVPQRHVVLCYPGDRPVEPAARYVGNLFKQLAAELAENGTWGGEMIR